MPHRNFSYSEHHSNSCHVEGLYRKRALAGAALPVALVALWLGPLLHNALAIPLEKGFDALHHVAYVEHLREHGTLPNAFDGWSMFHPPLYYVATALAVEALGANAALGWKLFGVLAGLASVLAFAAYIRASVGVNSGRRA